MRTKLTLLCFLFTCCFAGPGMAQTITGRVVDKTTREAVIGANVIVVDNPGIGTATDADGRFSLTIPGGRGEINVSFIGYKEQTVAVTQGRTHYEIELESENVKLEEVVVVGFGTQRKVNLTGAVTTINADDVKGSAAQNLDKGLQGRVPGMTITYRNGDLSTSPQIQVRGLGSLNGTGVPLMLVDNVEVTDLRTINVEDIESMSLLKDAASSSIYGTRAAFGVLLITTKSGRRNQKSTISYSNNFGWNSATTLPNFPSDPVADLKGGILANARNQNFNPELFGMYFNRLIPGIENWLSKYADNRTSDELVLGEDWEIIGGQAYFYRIWDPKKIMLKNWSAQQTHNLQLSGGAEKIGYYASLGYNKTDGIWKPVNDNIRRINASASINASVTDWLDMNLKYQSDFSTYDQPFDYQDYFQYMWRWGAFFPYGTYNGIHFRTPNGFMKNANVWSQDYNAQRINSSFTVKITSDIKLNVDYAYSTRNGLERRPGGAVYLWDFWTAPFVIGNGPTNLTSGQDYIQYMSSKQSTQTFNAYGTWTKNLREDHHLKLIAGFSSESGNFFSQTSRRNTLLDKDFPELPLAIGDQTVAGNRTHWSVAGFFARINYDYKGKWLLEVNGRYDGSSKFPSDSQWAFFPSASAGYRISSEPFMEFAKPFLNDFKFRGSYGSIGNQDVGDNRFIPIIGPRKNSNGTEYPGNWIEGTSRVPYLENPQIVPSALTWERVNSINVGFDSRFWNDMFNLTFDWFRRDTKDMIAPGKTLPAVFGAPSPVTNAGDLRSQGWEVALGYDKLFANGLKLTAGVTLSDYTTKITKWNNPSKLLTGNYTGKIIGEIWGFETDRYFTKDDDMSKLPDQTKLPSTGNFKYGPGDIKYKDLDDSKVIDGGLGTFDNHGDLKVIGNTSPRYQYGIRAGMEWKGVDFEFYFQGVGKRKLWPRGDTAIPYYRGADMLLDHQLDYWTESNPNAKYPNPFSGNNAGRVAGLVAANGGNNFYPQTKYLLNMAYLRLKNVTLGYTFPRQMTEHIYLSKVRVYVSAQNLFEISNVGIPIDPEVNFNSDTDFSTTSNFVGRSYPYARTLSFGLQVTF